MKKILAFRTDRLGDYLICSKLLHSLKIKYGHLTVVCSKINYKLIVNQNFIDEVILYDKSFSIFTKLKIFIKLFFNFYFLIIAWDGKKFSIFCSLFLFGKNKVAIIYKKTKKIFNTNINLYRPPLWIAKIFFRKTVTFTSKDNLFKTEHLPTLYKTLVSNFTNENNKDYYLELHSEDEKKYNHYVQKYNLSKYIFIHFDEKWLDIDGVDSDLLYVLTKMSKNLNIKLIISSYNNNHNYYINLKNDYNKKKLMNIVFLENLEFKVFERFINYANLNISCHSGSLVQLTGFNKAKCIDIINKKDKLWVSCWIPFNVNYQQIFKNNDDKRLTINQIFENIIKIYEKNI